MMKNISFYIRELYVHAWVPKWFLLTKSFGICPVDASTDSHNVAAMRSFKVKSYVT